MGQGSNFLESLFDFSFKTFITTRIIKVLYALCIAAAALVALYLIVATFAINPAFGVVVLLIIAPLYFVLSVIFSRVYLELIMVIFRIAENTTAMAHGSAGDQTPGPY